MKNDFLTIPEIKETLPDVLVKIGKDNYIGKLSGGLETFARVSFDYMGIPASFVFAWEAIQASLNSKRPLRVK
jgi:hypothetical protein